MLNLADELKMSKPFSVPQEEATLAIIRTADVLQGSGAETLKAFDITPPQYNVLRILRGSPAGLPCGQIAERMINRDPDVTRLLDRMESRKWITRKRSGADRRQVVASITAAGIQLLQDAFPAVVSSHKIRFASWSEKQMRQLIQLLALVRESESTNKEKNHDQQIRD